jgi:citrate synthase
MAEKCTLTVEGKSYEFPVVEGTEHEKGIDIGTLRSASGHITLDESYGNTGSCESKVTFIDGERGILRYRGYPIEEVAEYSTFPETAYLLIFGELPTRKQLAEWSGLLTAHEMIHEDMKHHFEGFPPHAHPMAILSAMINALSCYDPHLMAMEDDAVFDESAARLMSRVRTIASFAYKKSKGEPPVYPKPELSYTANFLHMMFSIPYKEYALEPDVVRALDLLFLLHADHEQNCSTSTVRMVASSKANLFASVAAGVCALWGPLHGGANMSVIEMLEGIKKSGADVKTIVQKAKDKNSGFRLMGFGHRVYKHFDPRAKIIKAACDKVLSALNRKDPLLDIARSLEDAALSDPYFAERKLYPNVDFYSGIILRAIGIPTDMFTVIFSIGRIPGWIANYREVRDNPKGRIYRPRQIYQGPAARGYVPIEKR